MSNTAARQLDAAEQDAVKGLLILLIAIGHNSILTRHIPHLFSILYTFHVFAFFFLAFLRPAPHFGPRMAITGAIRYLVPYLWFAVTSGLLFWLMYRRADPAQVVLSDLLTAAAIGSANLLDKATGFQLFWFLPAFFSLYCLRSGLASTSNKSATIFSLLAVAVHLIVGASPKSVKDFVPMGVLIALYIYPLALFASKLWEWSAGVNRHTLAMAAFLLTGSLIWLFQAHGGAVNLAVLQVYSIGDPAMLALQDAIPPLAFVFILAIAPALGRSSLLVYLGKNSLAIFLLHSLAFQALLIVFRRIGIVEGEGWGALWPGMLLLFMTIGSACVAAEILKTSGLSDLIFPRSSTPASKYLTGATK